MVDHAAHGSVRGFFIGLVPLFVSLCAIMFSNLPISLTGGIIPAPVLALAPIYFWTLLRPDVMPPVIVLGIGLLQDLFSGGPPGVWAGGFLAAYAFADRQRDVLAGLAGIGAVLGFACATFLAGACAYVLASVALWRTIPAAPLLLQCAVTTVFYPLAILVMKSIQRRFIGAMRD